MKSVWDERYSNAEYIYGEEPNVFFAGQINKLKPGVIIMPCDGEGRNGVYAASHGWIVNAFDRSEVGKIKAMELAEKKGVAQKYNYAIEDAMTATYADGSADAIAFIYAHFPPDSRRYIHQRAINWLRPGGKMILEAFNPQQLNNTSGGPKDIGLLYTEEMIKEDFWGLETQLLQTLRVELSEGKYHEGISDITRFVGIKL